VREIHAPLSSPPLGLTTPPLFHTLLA
jgi:hypothetical protein